MPTFADANKKQQQFNLIKTMKRTKKNVMMVARPLNVQERKEIMEHLTDGMEPVGEEEMSQVEINEEFGLAGKMMLTLLFQWLSAENRKAMDRLLRFYHAALCDDWQTGEDEQCGGTAALQSDGGICG